MALGEKSTGEIAGSRIALPATIDYTVRRSRRRRKTVQISVVRGEVIVSAPARTPARELEDIVRSRMPWIRRQLSKETREPEPRRFISGETLPYLGRSTALVIEPADSTLTSVRFHNGQFRIAVPDTLDDAARVKSISDAIIQWYRGRAEERLPELVRRWLPRLGGSPSKVLIRNQKQRWGSCSADGTLRFNWRVMMLKPALIEYIVVHELAHLTHQNHSRDYWEHVTAAMPDAQQRRSTLRDAGRKLPTL